MPQACLVAVDFTAFFVPGFAAFSMEIVFLFCFSSQMINSDAENFLVSLSPAETQSSIAHPLSDEGNLQHSTKVHGIPYFFLD